MLISVRPAHIKYEVMALIDGHCLLEARIENSVAKLREWQRIAWMRRQYAALSQRW